MGFIGLCYGRHLAKDPELAGSVVYRWSIDHRGEMSVMPELISSTLNHSKVERCVEKSLRSGTFPKTRSKGDAQLELTLEFSSEAPTSSP